MPEACAREQREALWTRLEPASFLTGDEKRAVIGYGPKDGGQAAKFNPNHDALGRFTTGDGSGSGGSDAIHGGEGNDRLSQAQPNQGYQIDLVEEVHVGKTPDVLQAHVRQQQVEFFAKGIKGASIRAGSFTTGEAAARLTNATLSANSDRVQAVARGEKPFDFVTSMFGSPTGTEAYARNVREQPTVRPTFGVGVRINYDPVSRNGFTVITSYPRNDD